MAKKQKKTKARAKLRASPITLYEDTGYVRGIARIGESEIHFFVEESGGQEHLVVRARDGHISIRPDFSNQIIIKVDQFAI